ncbi:elongation factor G-like protein EF-G2 [Streptomyces sp. BI20]|uniref:elongation factor G-like protein EF-G2 n=1 Tax=Streptomyces sp. BI20 TaxID=3403460 RepID=UPI003C774438
MGAGSAHHQPPGAAGGAPTVDHPRALRNVVLVGPTGSGKTTLVEALALATGAITRAARVEDGGTVSDHDELEQRRHRSLQLSLTPVAWEGLKINLLDTPGRSDFTGELRAGLRAADAALFVVSAAEGAEGPTGAVRGLWEECAAVGMPRAIVVTHLEAARADLAAVHAACGGLFGGADPDSVLPLHLPLHGPAGPDGHAPVVGLIGLLSRTVRDYSGGVLVEREPTASEAAALEPARARLIEGIIAASEDESLMDRYLAGAEIDLKTLVDDLERAVARGGFHPVLPAAPGGAPEARGLGTAELLELIAGGFPSPEERAPLPVTGPDGSPRPPLPCDPEGPLAAEVIRTSSDPYVGRVSLVRVFSGTLRPDAAVHVCGRGLGRTSDRPHEADERVGALTSPFGRHQRPVPEVLAGDLACVAKLARAETGDTLAAKEEPLLITPWDSPDALLPVAIRAHGKADEDKLSQGLARLLAEDPTLRLEQNPDTRQLVLWCLGEAHQEVALERLRGRFGVRVDAEPHRIGLRETITAKGVGRGRHVKQSGGHGQFAICAVEVEPLPTGSGIEFVDRVVGGAVPRAFVPSVEKGVRAQAARGLAEGRPLVDLRVTLVDGKAHAVDSSDAAFQTAGALALREAVAAAGPALLEPVAALTVLVPDEFVGPVMSDLSGRRGRVVGSEPAGPGRTVVRAEVPEAEIDRYAVDLRALSHGSGRFGRGHARHEPVPPGAVARLRELAEKGTELT